MDIRNFFGGKNSSAPKSSINCHPSTKELPFDDAVTSQDQENDNSMNRITSNKSMEVENYDGIKPIFSSSAERKLSPSATIGSVTWKAGECVPYAALVATFEAVSQAGGRLEKENIFCRLFRAVICTTPAELISVVYLASNSLSPAYEGLELGIGDALLVKAICEATGRNKSAVDEAYAKEGDLGSVALASRASQTTLSFAGRAKPLPAAFVLEQLREIALTKGDKAQARKVMRIKSLMVRCQGCEAKYVVRALQGKLRIGTAAQTVLVALSHAFAQVAIPASAAADAEEDEEEEEEHEEETEGEDSSAPHPVVAVYNSFENALNARAESTSSSSEAETDVVSLLNTIEEVEPAEARLLREDVEGTQRLGRHERIGCAEAAVKRAFSECPSLQLLVAALLARPLHELHRACRLVPGIPVHPMLAKPTKAVGEVLRRLAGLAFTMEYKYDGERAQVHLLPSGEDGSMEGQPQVRIFSRNSEDNSDKYPDLHALVRRCCAASVHSCVVDAEVVAYDREKGCLLPFQVLSTRKRKLEAGEEERVRVVLQLFDLLYVNGRSLLPLSLRRRRALLHACFVPAPGLVEFAHGEDHVENGDTAPIEAALLEACAAQCEGLMVKTLDSSASYEPSKRSLNWLKLKKDYIVGMGVCDSVDLVVLGAYIGRGKRTNVYGAYLMGCYDPDRDEFQASHRGLCIDLILIAQSCCKVGTGFSDEDLLRLSEALRPLALDQARRPHNYAVGDALQPDVWFRAAAVWELQAADLSKSSVHKAGTGRLQDAGRGVGLRFPRFIRERPDKNAEHATKAEQLVEMYFSQDLGSGGGASESGDGNDDEDELI